MAIIVQLIAPSRQGGLPAASLVVRAGIPSLDRCRILTRLNAFVVDQGVCATLEHTFRDRTAGNPIDVSEFFAAGALAAVSDSSSSSSSPSGSVVLRVKEWLGNGVNAVDNPMWSIDGYEHDAEAGVVRANLPATLVERAGIYEAGWAIYNTASQPVLINRAILSVERSLFPAEMVTLADNLGPPTLQELRMRIMDSAGVENTLLRDMEFTDDQVLLAMWEPVRYWNEALPPIKVFTTRSFPFRGAWVSGVMAQLHFIAANHYRRNFMPHSAGGVSVEDKNKEREYLAEGSRLWKDYTDWVSNRKVAINLRLFVGAAQSAYSTRSGW